MNAEEFKKAQHRTGRTSAELARLLGVSERTVYRYRARGCPVPVAHVLRSMA